MGGRRSYLEDEGLPIRAVSGAFRSERANPDVVTSLVEHITHLQGFLELGLNDRGVLLEFLQPGEPIGGRWVGGWLIGRVGA